MRNKLIKPMMLIGLCIFVKISAAQTIPVLNNDQKKQEWIQKNPDEYKKALEVQQKEFNRKNIHLSPEAAKLDSIKRNKSNSEKTNADRIKFVDLPGFPEYINTGNKDLDNANYSKAKDKWIKENPESYNQMNQSPVDRTRK